MKRTHDEMVADDHENGEEDNTEDSTDKVAPYDAKTEKMPDSPFFTDEYKALDSIIQALVKLLNDSLTESTYRNDVINGLIEGVKKRTKGDFPEEVKVALIGDMKAGKSSVINSILSVGTIARQGDAGSSCTWVVNEFRYLLPKQSKSFAAEVHFFSQNERHDIISALFADYYRASPKDVDEADGPKDSDQKVEDYGIMRTTVTAFRALFNDHEEFSSVVAANKFLSSASCENDEAILEILCDWSDQLMAKGLGNETCIFAEANTPQSLLWGLAPYQYTVEERDSEPIISLWPFVSHIKFGLDNPLLKNNITLVDLPGLSDTNKTRVANAVNHLTTCTHYMVIAEIGRADDDKFIRDGLSRGCMSRGSGRTTLVLTHADTIDEATEIHGTTKDQQHLQKLISQMKDLEKKKTEMTSRIKSAQGLQKYEFMERKEEIAVELRDKKAKHQEYRIAMRSKTVVKQMQALYAELTPDPLQLPVFCVGNQAYKKHQAGFAVDDPNPPTLSVEATNIPALRQHLFLAPAEGRLNETRHQVVTQLPSLISCFSLYVSKTHMARKDEIQKHVTEPQKEAVNFINGEFEKLKLAAEDCILAPFQDQEAEWADEARELCQSWARMYSTSIHLQFLKKDGIKKGKGKGASSISWNAELLSLRSGEIRAWFTEYLNTIDQIFRTWTKQICGLLSRMGYRIKNDPQVTLMALQPFLDYIFVEKGNVDYMVKGQVRGLRKKIGLTSRGHANMTATTEVFDNPIVQAMVPVYDKARSIKGRGHAPAERVRYFEKRVGGTGNGVWVTAYDTLRAELDHILDSHGHEMKRAAIDFFVGIDNKFNMMCADNELENEEETAVREKLGKTLLLAKDMLENEIRPAAKACFGDL